jgi:signal transduction histidine kinase
MKKAAVICLVFVLGVSFAGMAAAENATKEECIQKCKEAANMITEKGLDAGVQAINDKSGQFVWKDTYVFLMDMDGKMLAHPIKPDLIGKNLSDTADENGKLFFKEFIEVAKSSGEGWVDYMWPKPGEETASKKSSNIYRVPGQDLLVGAGIYE